MIKIAHRGNFLGKNSDTENTLDQLLLAIDSGYHIEVDVWLIDQELFLGHDRPIQKISQSFLENNKVWTHAKNFESYLHLYSNPKINVFWHDKDPFVFTSKGIKWANVGVETFDGIMVMPEYDQISLEKIKNKTLIPFGICSDNFSLFNL